jgi:hypothetical protein
MYTQKTYLLRDLEAALAQKVRESNATAIGALELLVGNDGRACLCTVIRSTVASDVLGIDL